MAEERVQRRLAAILAADVVGYSRLMGVNEAGTRAQFNGHLHELIEPAIASHRGRVVKTTGDALLVEFASVVDAVECAVDIQSGMAERNGDEPDDRRMDFRIGVNLGDVIIEGDDVHGDGVNVAARLEGLCEPGAVYVSGAVFEQVTGKLDAAFENLGEQAVKNISRPIRVYRVGAANHQPTEGARPPPSPERLSIAVLPFENMSGDVEQEYFSDGISEDIITALSNIRQFTVIARSTTFTYKGQAVDVQAVAADLGVAYVLEGSVRKAGNRVRITAQLIDGGTGSHIWAEHYDRELEDVFAVQDEITLTVVGAMEPELSRAEQERARLKPPENMNAWDCYQRGLWHLNRINLEDIAEAIDLFQRSIEQDGSLVGAHAGLATAHFYGAILGPAESRPESVRASVAAAREAVRIDSSDPIALVALGRAYQVDSKVAEAIPLLERSIELNPSLAQGYYNLGAALNWAGRSEEAIPRLEMALRLSPRDTWTAHFMARMSEAHLFGGRLEEAVDWGTRARHQQGPFAWTARVGLAAALGHLGRPDEAAPALEDMRQQRPGITLRFVRDFFPIQNETSMTLLVEGLRKAGLAE